MYNDDTYAGLIWPNGSAYDEEERACFQNPKPWQPPPPPPPPPPVLPPGCGGGSACEFVAPSNSSVFSFLPAISRTLPCWRLATGPGYCHGSAKKECPAEVALCPVGGAAEIQLPKGQRQASTGSVELLFKQYHDCGIFDVKVNGKVVQTVDAFAPAPVLNWWGAITLPAEAEAVSIVATGQPQPPPEPQPELQQRIRCLFFNFMRMRNRLDLPRQARRGFNCSVF
jgi:hypothetical protein